MYRKAFPVLESTGLDIVIALKCVEYVIGACAAVLLKHYLGRNIVVLLALVSLSVELHAMRKLVDIAPDISFLDVFLLAIMEIAFHQTLDKSCAFMCVLVSSCAAAFYKYRSYSTPVIYAELHHELETGLLVDSISNPHKLSD
ncbi:hypothetical protein TorRG33x02_085430 [Trema orientale]|uniref:Uncharacterized protein n=1 Tax=Trema orientale TaxID=63057 RepID=A0A2P5FD58_TREOI|nr:hypothetical protein TorRG33x02_085430 [Trema orientale]